MVKKNEAESCEVYFDGSCPLCRREIDFYRRRDGADAINWVDVSAADYAGGGCAPAPDTAMKQFHVKRADGTIVSGGAAFAELWAAIPALRPLGILFRHPPFSWAIALGYRAFLPLRPWLQKFAARRG